VVLLFWSRSWSCKQRSWSWSCYFGLISLGLKNLVLFTSLVSLSLSLSLKACPMWVQFWLTSLIHWFLTYLVRRSPALYNGAVTDSPKAVPYAGYQWSNGTRIRREIHSKVGPQVPPFKVTRGHRKWHASINCRLIPIQLRAHLVPLPTNGAT